MELVISIVSWNTRDLLRGCLASLQTHCKRQTTRVIVVDNASSDGSAEMVREQFPLVNLISSGRNLGFGRAHNIVGAHSEEPFILFLNPDTEFVEDACSQMLAVLRKDLSVAMVGCAMEYHDGSVQPLGIQWDTSPLGELLGNLLVSSHSMSLAGRLLPLHDPRADGYVKEMYGSCLMVRRAVLNQIGWFDERFFMYAEDVDLCRRVRRAGWKLYYLGSVKVIHLGRGACSKAPRQFSTLMQCESLSLLMQKYYGWPGRRAYGATILCRALLRLALLVFARAASPLIARGSRTAIDRAFRKHLTMLKWSLGITRPSIPV